MHTDFGPLFLHIDFNDGSFDGFYPKQDGRVFGQLSKNGRGMHGMWVQAQLADHPCDTARHGSRSWGHFVFVYDDRPERGARMSGQYGYCDEEPTRPWNGVVE